jgi:hypothetical protein
MPLDERLHLIPGVMAMAALTASSASAVLTWLGAAAFLLYNSLMFVFATPVNRLFLLYLTMLSLSAWSIATVLRQADVRALAGRFSPRVPVRGIAAYEWVIVTLNMASQDRTGAR